MRKWNEFEGALSNSAVTIPANNRREGLILANLSDTVMTFRPHSSPATAAIGVPIPPGTAVRLLGNDCPSGPVSLFCAGSAKRYTCYEIV